jgi:hypothetical protein
MSQHDQFVLSVTDAKVEIAKNRNVVIQGLALLSLLKHFFEVVFVFEQVYLAHDVVKDRKWSLAVHVAAEKLVQLVGSFQNCILINLKERIFVFGLIDQLKSVFRDIIKLDGKKLV